MMHFASYKEQESCSNWILKPRSRQALNMSGSGLNVVVGLREEWPSWQKAIKDGFTQLIVEEAVP